ncbi:MAG: glycyl-radical enzyme activating protein [Thermodesulfobacteriota bacterium]
MSSEDHKGLTGLVLDIQRMSTEDGPGIRTTVFFKGCPLRCLWCHNPESISPYPQLVWMGARCIGCRTCLEVCPNGALDLTPDGMRIDRSLCRACGSCAEECPSTALELLGQSWKVEALVREVLKDKAYFFRSGGGVTASGGEATLQADFVAAFLAQLKNQGLHTAVDTCGLCSREDLLKILAAVDLVLFDLKAADPARHRSLCGVSNEKILENLDLVRERIEHGLDSCALWIRTPVIPGATDTEENLAGLGRHIARRLDGLVQRWELCSFNNLARDKYVRLGLDWAFKATPLLTREAMERAADAARRSGVNPDIVQWTGATRVEDRPGEKPRLQLVKSCPGV